LTRGRAPETMPGSNTGNSMRGSLSLLVVLLALVSIIGLVMGGALMLPTDLGLGGWEPIDVDRTTSTRGT
jgi:hypothetical protein